MMTSEITISLNTFQASFAFLRFIFKKILPFSSINLDASAFDAFDHFDISFDLMLMIIRSILTLKGKPRNV